MHYIPRRVKEALNDPQSQPAPALRGAWIKNIFNPHTPPRGRWAGLRSLAGTYHSVKKCALLWQACICEQIFLNKHNSTQQPFLGLYLCPCVAI